MYFEDREEAIAQFEKMPELSISKDDLHNLPFMGAKVWAVKKWGDGSRELLQPEVTGYTIMENTVCVIIDNFNYKPHNEVFATKPMAEEFFRKNPDAC